jgi:tryptophanyl-tRNA synthetase
LIKILEMARILTGVQSTGTPHLGNLLGAVLPAIEMAKATSDNSFCLLPIYIP